ncbi:heme exporter protein CcmD [Algicola sagamiensis]|uniref:heme exporter protein CcmD n=1 Tax=Algicola sagamiensis TaxID=163869 RepID=UPI00035D5970|nr:heme exporter protein CcmD [Algicola sagamiensis]
MAFDSFEAFIQMGGYGFYVWLSYGSTALIMVGLIGQSIFSRRRLIQEIRLSSRRAAKRAAQKQQLEGTP